MSDQIHTSEVNVALVDDTLKANALQAVAVDLAATISKQKHITARLAITDQAGTKGDVQTIGSIVLQLAGSGGAIITLLNVFKSYVDRKRTLSIELTRHDGSRLSLSANNLSPEEIENTNRHIHNFFAGAQW